MCFAATVAGREASALSLMVKQSFATSQLLTTKTQRLHRRILNAEPYLSAIAPSVR